jgi:hypothetical protein
MHPQLGNIERANAPLGEEGASLVQVLVAIALAGILTVVGSTLYTNMVGEAAYQSRLSAWQQELIVNSQKLHEYCQRSSLAQIPLLSTAAYQGRGEPRTNIQDFQQFKFIDSGNYILRTGVDKLRELEIAKISLIQESSLIGTSPALVMFSL